MKILCVSHYYPPHVGGLEIVAQKTARSFATHGHEVSVVSCRSRGEPDCEVDPFGVTISFVRAWNYFDQRFGIPFPVGGLNMIRTIWREVGKADVVHIHDVFYTSSWCAYLCARLQRKLVVLTQHVGIVEHTSAVVMMIQTIVYATIGRSIFRASRQIIVYNDNVKKFLASQSVDMSKVLELRNGIDLTLFEPISAAKKRALRKAYGLPLQQPIALFVGRFVPKKGADVVFAARDESFDIVFAGSGAVPKEWQNTSHVHVLGPFAQRRLVQLYQLADVFVLPARGEVFTLAMQEAMACGLPIITTNDPGYRAYDIDRNLIAFVHPTRAETRSQLMRILSKPLIRKKMSEYSHALAVEWFDWEKNFQPILAVYERFTVSPAAVVTTSWDDGHILDFKIAELLRAHGLSGTFYISPKNQEVAQDKRLTPEQIVTLSKDFEIGAHTMTHPRLTTTSDRQARYEIYGSKEYLETVTKQKVVSFCYPQGYFNERHKRMAKDAGFTIARTVARFSFCVGNDRFEAPTTVHAYRHWSDFLPILRAVGPFKFLRCYLNWDELAIELFEKTATKGGIFHLWGHSWEIDDNGDWERLARVVRFIGSKDGMRHATNAELV